MREPDDVTAELARVVANYLSTELNLTADKTKNVWRKEQRLFGRLRVMALANERDAARAARGLPPRQEYTVFRPDPDRPDAWLIAVDGRVIDDTVYESEALAARAIPIFKAQGPWRGDWPMYDEWIHAGGMMPEPNDEIPTTDDGPTGATHRRPAPRSRPEPCPECRRGPGVDSRGRLVELHEDTCSRKPEEPDITVQTYTTIILDQTGQKVGVVICNGYSPGGAIQQIAQGDGYWLQTSRAEEGRHWQVYFSDAAGDLGSKVVLALSAEQAAWNVAQDLPPGTAFVHAVELKPPAKGNGE